MLTHPPDDWRLMLTHPAGDRHAWLHTQQDPESMAKLGLLASRLSDRPVMSALPRTRIPQSFAPLSVGPATHLSASLLPLSVSKCQRADSPKGPGRYLRSTKTSFTSLCISPSHGICASTPTCSFPCLVAFFRSCTSPTTCLIRSSKLKNLHLRLPSRSGD